MQGFDKHVKVYATLLVFVNFLFANFRFGFVSGVGMTKWDSTVSGIRKVNHSRIRIHSTAFKTNSGLTWQNSPLFLPTQGLLQVPCWILVPVTDIVTIILWNKNHNYFTYVYKETKIGFTFTNFVSLSCLYLPCPS